MSTSQNMVVGYIPQNWDPKLERVCVGDPTGSKTVEVNFQFVEDKFEFPAQNIIVDGGIWIPSSNFWSQVANTLQRYFPQVNVIVNPNNLGRAYRIFTEEDNDFTGLELVAGPADGGEFRNDKGQYNGRFYFRYESEDDGEYFDERIIII
jgi:hypothetical protein